MGTDLLSELENQPNMLSQKMTPEAMISAFHENAMEVKAKGKEPKSTGMIVADEIATYLNQNSIQRGMLPVLLKLHDCQHPFEYKTRDRGTERLPRTYATFLAGSAPEYLRKSLPSDEAGGGMLARTILVYQEEPRAPQPFLSMDDENRDLRRRLVNDLERIGRIEGKMTYTSEAHDWYEQWYVDKWHKGRSVINHDESLKHYLAKKPDHLQSLAQIVSVAESDSLEITVNNLNTALNLLNSTEKHMSKPLSNIVSEGRGVITKTVRDAIAVIYSYNMRPTYKNILKRIHKTVDYEEMKRAIDTLNYAGIIEKKKAKDNGEIYFVPNEDIDKKEWEDDD